MSKPVRDADIRTVDGGTSRVKAMIDSGAYHAFIREDKSPRGALMERLSVPKTFGQAESVTKLTAIGVIYLEIHIEGHEIDAHAFVAPKLSADLIIGAQAMQSWDITIRNDNGRTTVIIGHDLRDPDIQTVL